MAFQQGTAAISNGASSIAVTFATPFTAVPEVILAVVRNYTDASVLLIDAYPHIRSTGGFTAQLTAAAPSANYILEWVAGSVEILYQTLATMGLTMNQLPLYAQEPGVNDLFPMMTMSPLPASRVIRWSVLRSFFAKLVSTPPTSPTKPAGSFGQIANDENYFYFHNGTVWQRIPKDIGTDWTVSTALKPVREGVITLDDSGQDQSFTFDVAFPSGSAPFVELSSVQNVAGATLAIWGMVTASSLAGFTVHLSGTPDHATNYKMRYRAIQD